MTATPTTVEAMRKGEIQEKLRKFNSKEVRANIIEVLMESRKIPKKEAGDIKTLRPAEVALVFQRFE